MTERVVALAGGVGGARLCAGLAAALAPEALVVVVNTGDDFDHLGLHVSPDLDTVLYTLAGLESPETGWGRADETWGFMETLGRLGGETWFRLGDRDLAMHVLRTSMLRSGHRLSEFTETIRRRLGIAQRVTPVSDDPVRTVVLATEGRLAFQDYFVRRRCEPEVRGFEFPGAAHARPAPALASLMHEQAPTLLAVCPSNPFVSIAPILAVAGVRAWLERRRFPVVAVSPIVGGRAVKGPADKMLRELRLEVSALGIARHYGELVDVWIIDEADAALAQAIRALGPGVIVAPTLMRCADERANLARVVLAAGRQSRGRREHR